MLLVVHRRGFSLAEVLFALGLVSLIAVTLLGVIPAAITATKEAGHQAAALRVGQSTVEDLARSSASLGAQPVFTQVLNGMEFVVRADIALATPDVAVQSNQNSHSNPTTLSNLDPQQARVISVTVSWHEKGRRPRSSNVRRQIFVTP